MKCPSCSKHHPYKSGMKCRCGYRFILDPKKDGYADGRVLAAIRRASGSDSHYFTKNQLSMALLNMQKGSGFAIGCGGLCIAIAIGLLILTAGAAMPVVVIFAVAGIFMLASGFANRRLNTTKFQKALQKFESKTGPIPKLLRDDAPLKNPPPDWEESDIYDYGAEGILIVDQDVLVDQLVLNGFHSSNRVLVVSENGYPSYMVERVNQILDKQSEVRVEILHGATSAGDAMAERLKRSPLFHLQNHEIRDLGISKDQLKRFPKLRRFAQDGEVSLDYLNWTRLSTGLAAVIAADVLLADAIGRDPNASITSFG